MHLVLVLADPIAELGERRLAAARAVARQPRPEPHAVVALGVEDLTPGAPRASARRLTEHERLVEAELVAAHGERRVAFGRVVPMHLVEIEVEATHQLEGARAAETHGHRL